ncbi:MAG: MoaD family protein [Methanomassiliicoccales archaeon]
MKVKFKTTSHLAQAAGLSELAVELECCTVRDVLRTVVDHEEVHEDFKRLVFPSEDRVSDVINILLNGKNVRYMDGLDTEVQDGDKVAVMPMHCAG